MEINHEQLEDWLDDNGYLQSSDNTVVDMQAQLDGQDRLIAQLLKRLSEQHMAITFILQGRVNGYTIKGRQVELNIDDPSHIEPDIDMDDEQPWLN